MNTEELVHRFYPESNIGGFSHVDGTITFFIFIAAFLKPSDHVLDFGAGRGEALVDDEVDYRRQLSNLQGRCAHLEGCDIDDVVLQNPFLDHAEVIRPGQPLPYSDERFDLIVARSVFEHIEHPEVTAAELLRVTKPGGLIAAVTPNKYGYIALAARLVPNDRHVEALAAIQPDRKPEDIFPTYYRVNTPTALKKVFGHAADVFVVHISSEPAYHFGHPLVYRVTKVLHKHLPTRLQPVLHVYIRKR
jgi:SAM-dependent methyltransferase